MPASPSGVESSSAGARGAPRVVTPPRCSVTSASGNACRSAASGSDTCGGVTKALPPPWVNGRTALCPMSAMRPRIDGARGRMPSSLPSTTVERAAASVRRATTSSSAGCSVAPLRVERHRLARRAAEGADAFGEAQDPRDLLVDDGLGDPSVLDGGEEVVGPRPAGAGHHEVEAAERGFDRRLGREPVADDDAVEAPLALEDAVEERAVRGRRGVDALAGEPVVRGHDRPHAGVDDRLERCQVDLAQGALVDPREVLGAVGLGLVADEVLDARGDALAPGSRRRTRRPGGRSAAGPRRGTRSGGRRPGCAAGSRRGRARRRRPCVAPRRP